MLEEEERDQHKLGRQIVREEHWLRYGVTARRKRNMRRLGELNQMRQAHRNRSRPEGKAALVASDAAGSGKLVIDARSLSKAYGDKPVVQDFSARIARGDRIGLVGRNGAGKTTLLRLVTGDLAPDSGTLKLGVNLEIATLDQKRAAFDPEETLAHFLTGGGGDQVMVNGEPRHVVSYMKDFLFKPEQARTPVRELSGGERARLALARILARPANLLVLDEPTNDLDMETLDLLQELIAGFAGTVLLVSHDRDFLDRTVTSTIVPEGDGRWTEYAGGYSDMLAQRGVARLDQEPGSKRKAPADSVKSPARPQASSKKLSYKQKFALETLPKKIAEANAEKGRLESAMADPDFFRRDPKGFDKASARLAELDSQIAAMEEEWLELEMLREEIEG